MEGGTTFHFVSEGIDVALERARAAAAGRDVRGGGDAERDARRADEADAAVTSVPIAAAAPGDPRHVVNADDPHDPRESTPMTDAAEFPPLPDRLAVDPNSPHHVAAVFEHPIGIRLNGKERFDVEEYCLSEGWVKVAAGKTVDRKGRPLLIQLKGKVEAFYR